VFTQVPPVVPRSTITTLAPFVRAAIAAANAAPPDPMTASPYPLFALLTAVPP
jgi:hypothetical protein